MGVKEVGRVVVMSKDVRLAFVWELMWVQTWESHQMKLNFQVPRLTMILQALMAL